MSEGTTGKAEVVRLRQSIETQMRRKILEAIEVVLEDKADGMLFASYEPLDLSGKWSAYDDMVFLDVDRIEPVVAPLVAAPFLGGLGGLGAAAAGAAIIAGGGGLNDTLVEAISALTDANVHLSDEFGITMTAREAVAMAVLGALAQDGIPITLPQVTGRSARTLGDGRWCLPRREFGLNLE